VNDASSARSHRVKKSPDFLCYYFRDRPSFRSVLDKGISSAKEFLSAHDTDWRSRQDYIDYRIQVEAWVRKEFVKKGGRPMRAYPIYMSLGTERMMEDDPSYKGKLFVPLRTFDRTQVSFTYLDSMHTKEGLEPIVFMMEELAQMIDCFGSGYNEAQVWDDSPLSVIRDHYHTSGKLDYRQDA
jgi:hypothetical protein